MNPTSIRQAAVFLSALPKSQLAAILKRLTPAHAAALADQLTRLGAIEQPELNLAIKQFLAAIPAPADDDSAAKAFNLAKPSWIISPPSANSPPAADAPPDLESPAVKADFKVRSKSPQASSLPMLEELSLERCLSLLHDEEASFLATVLFLLSAKKAAAIVEKMSLVRRVSVLQILSSIEEVSAATVEHVRQRMRRKIEFGAGLHSRPEGLHRARQLLEQLNAGVQRAIADALVAADPQLAAELHRHVFRLNDVVRLHNRDLRKICTTIPIEQWAPALKYAENRVREQVLAAMPAESSHTVREQLARLEEWTVDQGTAAQQIVVDQINDMFRRRVIKRPSALPTQPRHAA